MSVTAAIYRLGGVASRQQLVAAVGRRSVDAALRSGELVRDGRGRYAAPVANEARRRASALSAVGSHRSAALWWGWAQKHPDHPTEVTVPRRRKVGASRQVGVTVHWSDLEPHEIEEGWTSRERTLVDCLRSLPFDEALAIADSALRVGSIEPAALAELAARITGPGAAQARRVAAGADGRSANPFESVLRAISLTVPGLAFEPQRIVAEGPDLRPDLVDPSLALVAEADSFTWHGTRSGLVADCRRYNRLVVLGYRVLRFSWEDVMHEPALVRATLQAAVHGQAQPPGSRRSAA